MLTGNEAWFWTLWRADESPTNSGDYTPPPNHIGYTFPADGHNAIRIYSEVRITPHRANFVVEWGDFHYAGRKISAAHMPTLEAIERDVKPDKAALLDRSG
jgi:hypothetical protein